MAFTFTKGTDIAPTETGVTNTKHHTLIDSATVADGDRSNFAQSTSIVHLATTAPTSSPVPINGHLWYDTTNNILMEYDGTNWIPVSRGTLLTNQSGGAISAGEVVILDTGNAQSATTTTTASHTGVIGVVLVGAGNGSNMIVLTEGRVPALTVTGATSIGNYLFTSTTAGEATSSATVASGAFGRALTSTAGAGSVVCQLGGASVVSAGVDSDFVATDTFSGTQTHSSTGTQNISHSLGVVPKFITVNNLRSGGTHSSGSTGSVVISASGTASQSSNCPLDNTGNGAVILEGYGICMASSASVYARGVFQNFSTTGFDIVWTNVGSPGAITSNYVGMVYG